jgi:hypothetical protein
VKSKQNKIDTSMTKEELLQILSQKDTETLEALYKIALVFKPVELKRISDRVQNESTRILIKNYM